MQDIVNHLAILRKQRGISASALGAMAGVTRQTIYALEAGTYVPNTAVGLRLARALGVKVEDLFTLEESVIAPPSRSQNVTLLPSPDDSYSGQAVQLCQVDGKLIAAPAPPQSTYLPLSDAAVTAKSSIPGKSQVHFHDPDSDFSSRILLAGCDPAMAVLARYLQPSGIDLVLLHQNSSQSLSLLKRGLVHLAGTHFPREKSGDSNLTVIKRLFPKDSVAVISFAVWEEGLVAQRGNPKKIAGVQDLARKDITFINREIGSGSRTLLDHHLKSLKLDSNLVPGYTRTVPGHLAAAWEVRSGTADCCLATQAAAHAFGLHFIALASVRYDLAVRKQHLKLPGVEKLFDIINRASFRLKLKNAAGYETSITGSRLL